MCPTGTGPEEVTAKVRRFLALSDRFPDDAPMWATGGICLTWGDLRILAGYRKWMECLTCCYGTNSDAKAEAHTAETGHQMGLLGLGDEALDPVDAAAERMFNATWDYVAAYQRGEDPTGIAMIEATAAYQSAVDASLATGDDHDPKGTDK